MADQARLQAQIRDEILAGGAGANQTLSNESVALQRFYSSQITTLDTVTTNVVCVLCLLGVVGGIIEWIVLAQDEFKTPSFMYHKAIVFWDILFDIAYGFGVFPVQNDKVNTFVFRWGNLSCYVSMMLTMFVGFERVIALLFPTKFHLINKNSFVWGVILFSFLYGCLWMVDLVLLWMPNSDDIFYVYSFIVPMQLVQESAQTVLALMVCVGLFKLSQAQKKMQGESDAKQKARLNKQLALLSLSCAIPNFFHGVFAQAESIVATNAANDYIRCKLSFSGNIIDSSCIQAKLHADLVVAILTNCKTISLTFGHSTHFYLYALLSRRIRKATVKLFRKAWRFVTCGATHDANVVAVQPYASTNNTHIMHHSAA